MLPASKTLRADAPSKDAYVAPPLTSGSPLLKPRQDSRESAIQHAWLREFAEAAQALLGRTDGTGDVLEEVFPSFLSTFATVSCDLDALRAEFQAWSGQSERLARLAAFHGDLSSRISDRIEFSRSHAQKMLDALDAIRSLYSNRPLTVFGDATSSSVGVAHQSQVEIDGEHHLRSLCDCVLALTSADGQGEVPLSRIYPSLIYAFRDWNPELLTRLRSEWRAWKAQVTPLLDLASVHCSEEGSELGERVKSWLGDGQRLIAALESLQLAANGKRLTQVPASCRTIAIDDPQDDVSLLAGFEHADSPAAVQQSPTQKVSAVQTAPQAFQPRAESREPAIDQLYSKAEEHRRKNEYPLAEEIYSRIIERDPAFQLAFFHRAAIRLFRGDANGAIADLDVAILLRPDDANAWRFRGDAHVVAGNFEIAVIDYDRFLELVPNAVSVRYNRAVALRQRGDLETAWVEFERLQAANPNSAPVCLNRGLICLARGRRQMAIREFRRALQLQPTSKEALDNLNKLGVNVTSIPLEPFELPPESKQAPQRETRPRTQDSDDASEVAKRIVERKPPMSPSSSGAAASAVSNLVPTNDTEGSNKGRVKIQCPACRATHAGEWDQVAPGVVLTCRRCQGSFTTTANGDMVMVRRGNTGWQRTKDNNANFEYRRWLTIAASGLVVIAITSAITYGLMNRRPAKVAELPTTVEERAKLFVQAWVAKDYPTMRRLTDPSHAPKLFAWHRRHPTPATKRNVKADVVQSKVNGGINHLTIHVTGMLPPDELEREFIMAWRDRDGEWLFLPGGVDSSRESASMDTHKGDEPLL